MMKKILVVDDSETNLVLLKAILEDEGFEVVLANSSKEAFYLTQKNDISLILLDLLMPEMDGFSFLQSFNEESTEEAYGIPIVVVTAYANDENTRKAKELGAKDIIEKPIDIPHFLHKIGQVLDIKISRS
ncbi:MAG: response regulator [Bacteroidota bacterium]